MADRRETVLVFVAAVQGMVMAHGSVAASLELEAKLAPASAAKEARRLRRAYNGFRIQHPDLNIAPLASLHNDATRQRRAAAMHAKPARAWTDAQRRSIAQRFRKGATMPVLAEEFGVSRQRIAQLLAAAGVKSDAGGRKLALKKRREGGSP